MEDDKKRKKNKKKKNKQNKTTEDVPVGIISESASVDHSHIARQNHHSQVSETADVQNGDVRKPDCNLYNQSTDSIKGASLEETIKQLQNEKESYIPKEAELEIRIVQLQSEKESWLLKEASLEERTSQLLEENAKLSSNRASLEVKINQLLDENANLSSEGDKLEERLNQLETEKDSWIVKENSTKEILARLKNDNTILRMQVREVEESRNKLLQDNQLLMENISSLQSQIQNTSSARSSTETTKAFENEDLNSQIEAARSLIEKLCAENAELVEKVSELYIELDRQHETAGLASVVGSDPLVGSTETVAVAETLAEPSRVSVSDKRMESLEAVPIENVMVNGDNMDSEYAAVIVNSSEASESGETVQIPLDENEVQGVQSQAVGSDEKAAVPISDAPLIGAPFRFISFFAKYVSGADLVNNSSSN